MTAWDLVATLGLLTMLVGLVTAIKPIRAIWVPTRYRAAAVFAAGFVVLLIGASNAPLPVNDGTSPVALPASATTSAYVSESPAAAEPSDDAGVTMANYLRLDTGMSYREVVEILGEPGEEMSRSDLADITTVMYGWTASRWTGANMNAMFQNDRLVTKAQFGLR